MKNMTFNLYLESFCAWAMNNAYRFPCSQTLSCLILVNISFLALRDHDEDRVALALEHFKLRHCIAVDRQELHLLARLHLARLGLGITAPGVRRWTCWWRSWWRRWARPSLGRCPTGGDPPFPAGLATHLSFGGFWKAHSSSFLSSFCRGWLA